MVCEWGMSDRMGPLAFGKKDDQIFLGREINQSRDYSESTAIAIDEEVRRIVMEGYERAQKLLKDNLPILTAMAEALLERETLESADVALLLDGKALPPITEM
jgi:cell division protease FtsH